jgi:hypothetical protein
MSVLDHTNATHADGPALMAWLERHGRIVTYDPATRRRLQRWRSGRQASLACVDDTLMRLGLDLSQVPAHIWRRYDNGRTGFRSRSAA